MRAITYYIDKKTQEHKTHDEIFAHHTEFNTYEEYEKWRDENYEEREKFIESPYEKTRARVYASGNVWAIENFNATH